MLVSENGLLSGVSVPRSAPGDDERHVRTQAARHETPTLAAVFETHADFVWRQLKSLGVLEADIDDALQDVFLVVQRRLPEFDGKANIRTWLYAICLRKASEHRRRARHHREQPLDDLQQASCPTTPPPQQEQTERHNVQLLLERALAELPENKRQVFVLFEVEGLSMQEVAAAIQCPLFTAYSRLRAARNALKSKLRAQGVTL